MRPSRSWIADRLGPRLTAEEGTASLEFVTAGMILLLPMVYLVLTMSSLQGGSFAVEGAARQAARVFVQADDLADARAQAASAVRFALADYGIAASAARVDIRCAPSPSDCLHRSGRVTVSVEIGVALPLVPAALSVDAPLTIPLSATATQTVSRFRGAE